LKGVYWVRTKTIIFIMILVLILAVFAPAGAEGLGPIEPLNPPPVVETGEMVDETPALWFVELTGVPAADGGSMAALKFEKDAFRLAARRAKIPYQERYAFDTLWNGFSISAYVSELGKLQRLPGVKAIYPVETVALPELFESVSPDLFTALQMTGADIAQSELGYTGAGIKVAVMDTGIDVDHPAFGGDGVARKDSPLFPSARIAFGYDLVGDAFNADSTAPTYNPYPSPDPNPDDCNGHGTHVAGIIGANDHTNGLKGVAPAVTLGAYRVFGCNGSTFTDIMIAAMEMALADGMDILNMSIGSAYQWPHYPTAVAATRLVNKGVIVVASIGNYGANGLYSAGAPGLGKKVIGVAAYDNSHVLLPYFEVNETPIGYIAMTYSGPIPTEGDYEFEYVGEACDSLEVDLTGKVALAVRGICAFGVKAANAIDAGAEGVVVHNNAPGLFTGTLGAPIDGVTPVVGISQADGLFIRAQAPPVRMIWTDLMASFRSPTGGLISSFSSYGLSPDLSLKPDIGAPGGNIYSSYPLEMGAYATLGGTSMSSPHVAGAAALVLQAKPRTSSQIMRTILQNSADPHVWWGNPGLGFLDNVHRQGAGMVDIDDAILATTIIDPGKLSIGEGEGGPQSFTLSVENKGSLDVTYDLSYINALSTGGVITPSFFLSNAAVSFQDASLFVKAGGEAKVGVTITPATGPVNGQYGGYIVFSPRGGGQVYRVPFAGFVGDYQAIQVLTPTANGFPWLSRLSGSSYIKLTDPASWKFTMQGTDIPFFLVHFEHQSRLARFEVFDAQTGKNWHRFVELAYFGRNSSSAGFFAIPFDGLTFNGKKINLVPDGEYYIVLSVLKAEGEASNPAHWETWTSPSFVIDRP
jgi:minor extracellular serine protease Vpr